jgi:hypothetical protein
VPVIDTRAGVLKVRDADLKGWISSGSDERRAVIVETMMPARKVTFDELVGTWPTPKSLRAEGHGPSRSEILAVLRSYLTDLLGEEPTLLTAAGALAVEASGEQMRRVLEHPLVKTVRPNRRLAAR